MAVEQECGNVLSFRNISYEIESSTFSTLLRRKGKNKKTILQDVNGDMGCGLNAIMGPTGSGKSSLLDVLAKRKDPQWLTGKVYLNNMKLPSNYKYLSGYVVQNDILMGTLTVRESLWFSANMRLSSSVSDQEKGARVEELLEQLGLQKCAESKIGNDLIRGISGGERKRTAIALELITRPRVLFLDEPTTGLDASTANTVMRLLKKLASHGQTVVASIHQPRYSIFRLFDSLTLLSLGQCIYHGKASSALPYIESLGYECETHDNPADFFLDVINGEIESRSNGNHIEFDKDLKHAREIKITNYLRQKYLQRSLSTFNEFPSSQVKTGFTFPNTEYYAASSRRQLKHLMARDLRNFVRNPQSLLGTASVKLILAILFGIIFFQMDNSIETGTQNRFGLIFFISTNLMFDATSAIMTFSKGKGLFFHEYVSGYYSIFTYFLSKIFGEIVPLYVLGPLLYIIAYWMTGLKSNAASFFIFFLLEVLTSYSSVALGLFFSVTFDTFVVANNVTVMVMLFAMILSGYLVNSSSIPVWLSWLEYLSICKFSFTGLCVNEMTGTLFKSKHCRQDYNPLQANATYNISTCETQQGDTVLHDVLNIGDSSADIGAWDLWQNVVALAAIATGMFGLTYVQLIRCKKYS